MDGTPANKEAIRGVISRRIRFLLENHRLTVPQAATLLEMRARLLQEVLDGQTLPTDMMLEKVSAHFGVPLTFLRGGDSEPEASEESVPDLYAAPERTGSTPPAKLTLRTLATRHQALVELLIKNGVLTAADYNALIAEVDKRQS
ncbi:MAG: hypothetical protein AAF581_10525 [Planctomycetota bacterium]